MITLNNLRKSQVDPGTIKDYDIALSGKLFYLVIGYGQGMNIAYAYSSQAVRNADFMTVLDAYFDTEVAWNEVEKQMQAQEWHALEGNREIRNVFLGTVQNMLPSGKYYTVWSSEGVTEAEALADQTYFNKLVREAEERGYGIENGQGDPCDLHVVEYREKP